MLKIGIKHKTKELAETWEKAIKQWGPGVLLGLKKGMYRIQKDVLLNLTGRVLKVQTGRLRASIYLRVWKMRSVYKAKIGMPVWYGRMWEEIGMPAHIIKPVKAKALKIPLPSGTIYRMYARIPKKDPRPFIEPSIAANTDRLLMYVMKNLEGVVK